MNNTLTSWVLLAFFGISLTIFTLYYSFSLVEKSYNYSLELRKNEILFSSKIDNLKLINSELKTKIERLNAEVGSLAKKMNEHLNEYRSSKMVLDSLISSNSQSSEALDTIISIYNNEILKNTNVIDSINSEYEIKSTTLLQFIKDLDANSSKIENNLLDKKINNKLIVIKTTSIAYYAVIFILSLILGVWITLFSLKKIIHYQA